MKTLPVAIDPELMSGTPCFTGTRVPLKHLLDYLLSGASVDEFLRAYPTVDRAHIESFLYFASGVLIEAARAEANERIPHENIAG
ncbi:MAG: DUF433 domain-containing protein [Chloroflexota bacterium]|nr:DUF433 domain-containing protein [Chloroflexota bacterium]